MATTVSTGKRIAVSARTLVICVLLAFVLGLVPMWAFARSRTSERDAEGRVLQRLRMVDQVSAASLNAQRGEYEKARQNASAFFASLRNEVDNPQSITLDEREALRPVLAQRDQVITLLARSDPASVNRLYDIEHDVRSTLD